MLGTTGLCWEVTVLRYYGYPETRFDDDNVSRNSFIHSLIIINNKPVIQIYNQWYIHRCTAHQPVMNQWYIVHTLVYGTSSMVHTPVYGTSNAVLRAVQFPRSADEWPFINVHSIQLRWVCWIPDICWLDLLDPGPWTSTGKICRILYPCWLDLRPHRKV